MASAERERRDKRRYGQGRLGYRPIRSLSCTGSPPESPRACRALAMQRHASILAAPTRATRRSEDDVREDRENKEEHGRKGKRRPTTEGRPREIRLASFAAPLARSSNSARPSAERPRTIGPTDPLPLTLGPTMHRQLPQVHRSDFRQPALPNKLLASDSATI